MSEDSIDCPFVNLGLIEKVDSENEYHFHVGQQQGLAPEIIVVGCLEYAAMVESAKTISIPRLLYDPGSPGVVFKLTESALSAAIEIVQSQHEDFSFSGLIVFSFNGDPTDLAEKMLDSYYTNRRMG